MNFLSCHLQHFSLREVALGMYGMPTKPPLTLSSWGCPIPVCHTAGPCHTLSRCDAKTCNRVLFESIVGRSVSSSRDINAVRVEMNYNCRYTTTMAFFVPPTDLVSQRGGQRSLRRPCHGHVSIFGRGPGRSDLKSPAPSVPYLLTEWSQSHIKDLFR